MSSRVEELLAAAVDGSGTDGLDPPQSRNEKLLFALNDKLDNVESALAGKVDVPADGQAYQQLVTDVDGNAKWEDRLAYEGTNWKDFVLSSESASATTEITGFTMPPAGDTVRIKVNGVESVKTVTPYSSSVSGRYIGSYAPYDVAAGAPGWCIFCVDGEEKVHAASRVLMTISLLFTETHKIDEKYVPKEVYFVKFDGNSLDRTFDEITEAYFAGMIVVLGGFEINGLISYIGPEQIMFNCNRGASCNVIVLTPDNAIRHIYAENLIMDDNGTLNDSLILPSSTSGSSKRFKITVDDTGTISATEVT